METVLDTEEVPAPDGESTEVCVAPLPADAELDDESDPDDEDSPDAVSAHATPCPAKTAAPTPRATASPPTRPMYLEAPIASSCCRQLRVQRAKQCAQPIPMGVATPTQWEVLVEMPCRGEGKAHDEADSAGYVCRLTQLCRPLEIAWFGPASR